MGSRGNREGYQGFPWIDTSCHGFQWFPLCPFQSVPIGTHGNPQELARTPRGNPRESWPHVVITTGCHGSPVMAARDGYPWEPAVGAHGNCHGSTETLSSPRKFPWEPTGWHPGADPTGTYDSLGIAAGTHR